MSAFRLATSRRPADRTAHSGSPATTPLAAPTPRVRVAFGNPHPWEILKAILLGGSKG